MIEKITNMAKIENNSPVPTKVAVEFNQVKDLVEEYRYAVVNTADKDPRISMENMANKQNSLSNNVFQSVIIKFRPSQESLMIDIDRLKIYQVITNLPNNSFKITYKKI